MFNKKGLSGVITTVLIILISIAAIFIVWQILKPTLKDTAGSITLECAKVDYSVKALSCDISAGNSSIQVSRNAGAALSKLVILVADATGTQNSTEVTTNLPAELGFGNYNVAFPAGKNINKVSVGVFVTKADGSTENCGVVATNAVTCSA